jgi:WD40 repeat protein
MTDQRDDHPLPGEPAMATELESARTTTASPPAGSAEPASPYLGLRSFAEADRDLFHGRKAEADELLHLVQRETLSVVFGRSGLGKSSLLRAGLFPLLRDAGLFPIAVRLSYGESQPDLVPQIRAAIAAAIVEHHVEAAAPAAGQTLWEYFHRTPFWSARNRPLIPVVAIDQFEELFTLGRNTPGRAALLTELGDLIENRIPAAVRAAGDADALPPAYQVPKAKLILALREDYLARLEDLRPQIPSLARGRFRLRAMNGAQAVRAVRHDRTAHLVEPPVAERIVRFVAGARGDAVGTGAADLGDLTIEPALLSLVCRQLDEVRASRKQPTISADLLTGESARILDDFYERSVADLDPSVVTYLEDHLLTPDGHRTTVAMSRVAAISGMEPAVTALVDRRLLRIEVRLDQPHVEVIHDVLTRVMVARRDRRRAEHERRRRTRRWFTAIGAGALLALLATVTVLYLGARRRLEAEAEQQRAAVETERRANAQRSATTLAAEASSMFARDDVWAAARVLEVAYGITGQDSPPALALLAGRITALGSMLAAVLQPKSAVTALAFSSDGRRLFAGHQDGTVSMWSTSDWKLTPLAKQTAATAASKGAPSSVDATRTDPTPPAVRTGPIDALGVSDDGGYAVATNAEGYATIWETAAQQVRDTISMMERASLRLSHDGAWIVATNGDDDRLYHFKDGHYAPWTAPAISVTCRPTRAAEQLTLNAGERRSRTQLGMSGDGSILLLHHYDAGDQGSAGELSVFTLGAGGPSPLMTSCVPARADVVELSVNADGTAVALQQACSDLTDDCEMTSAIYRRGASLTRLNLIPLGARLTFDVRRPEQMLAVGKDRFVITPLGDGAAYKVSRPCKRKLEVDLVDGRLAALGACGAYVIAGRELPTIAGEIPLASYSAMRVSAAAQLAAVLSPDGVIRVWHLRGSPDRTLHSGRDVTKLAYLGDDRLLAYDGETARIFAATSVDPVATAPSDTAPVVVNDDTVAVSRQGQLGLLSTSGALHMEPGAATGFSAAALAAARDDAAVFVVTPDLRVRRVNKALQSTEYRAVDSPLLRTALRSLAHAPSGRWMIGAGNDSLIRFDATGQPEPPVAFAGGAQVIVPAAHGDGLFAIGEQTVAAWTAAGPPSLLETPSHVRILGRAGAWDMASGAIVLGTETGLVRLDARSGKLLWQVLAPFGDKAATTWVDLDPRDAASAVLAATSGRMALFGLDDGHLVREFRDRTTKPGDQLAGSWFMPQDLLVTRSREGEATLWDTRTGEHLSSAKHIADMARSASNDFAVVIDRQVGFGILHVRNRKLTLEAPLYCGPASAQPRHVAWSPDGQWIALAGLGGSPGDDSDWICLWHPGTRETATQWSSQQHGITNLAISADSHLLSRDGSTPRLWSVPVGSLVSEFARESLLTATFVEQHPYLITRLSTGPLRIYDADTAKQLAEARFRSTRDAIARYAVDEASGLLAIGHDGGDVAVINVRTGERVRTLTTDGQLPTAIAIAPGGELIAAAYADHVQLWSMSKATLVETMLDARHVDALAFSPDGRWLATADGIMVLGPVHGMLSIWSTADGSEEISFETDTPLAAVTWSRDGRHVAVGGTRGFVETFDLSREERDPGVVTPIIDRMAPRISKQAASPPIPDPDPLRRLGIRRLGIPRAGEMIER